MAQSHRRKPSTIESPNRSPVLEALYQDLDAFIHELTGDGGSKTEPLDTSFQLDDDAASHDDSAKDLKEVNKCGMGGILKKERTSIKRRERNIYISTELESEPYVLLGLLSRIVQRRPDEGIIVPWR